jgi:hypothetical protein
MPFLCSICGEESTRICGRCTKDTCNNHLCERCLRCSDCCECELVLADQSLPAATARSMFPRPEPEPAPEPPQPVPNPEPDPETDPRP